ncbi:MAG: hypothetical protein PF638_01970 [Candidatus Delongbacteria bacterium]|jgi:hypothetical protein|nr:hypothetical protein [Candidatus Delongbacteria bacterium]
MKFKVITFFILLTSLLFVGCSEDPDPISQVTVNAGAKPYTVVLSHDVYLPLGFDDAVFVMEECYEPYDTCYGFPVLKDGIWEFLFEPGGIADWKVSIDKDNAYVTIEEYGK